MNPTHDRRITPMRPDLAALSLKGQVEASHFAVGEPMQVVASAAALRREPRPDGPLDTEALMGELMTVYERREGWAWGQLAGDGYVGYLSDAALGPISAPATHKVSALRTFLYPGPSMKLSPLDMLSLGAAVTVTGMTGPFAQLASGACLWAAHLAPVGTHAPDFVTVAERFLHVPYLWGGKTSLGLDCSGLTQLSLAAGGIASPRDSDQLEAALGLALPIDDTLSGLQRGDLVFWKGHVGIMRDAETLLHATGHSMTVMSERLRQARDRILTNSFGAITSIRRL
jgi:cell wall-associated NlpC family hydrolase